MMYLSGLVGFLLVLTAEAGVGSSSQLTFCSETDQCLLFDLICETENYDVRHYESVKWVSTDKTCYFMEFALFELFQRLYGYINGNNDQGKNIEMTAPVVIKIPHKKFWQKDVYTMSFLLPAEYQADPPMPTDDKVYIHDTPNMTLYVQSYGGWMTSINEKEHASGLSAHLDSIGAQFKNDDHFAAGYNSPMTMADRRNEVWFVAEGEPVCSSGD